MLLFYFSFTNIKCTFMFVVCLLSDIFNRERHTDSTLGLCSVMAHALFFCFVWNLFSEEQIKDEYCESCVFFI